MTRCIRKPTVMGKLLLKGILLFSRKLCICWCICRFKREPSHMKGPNSLKLAREGENNTSCCHCQVLCVLNDSHLRGAWGIVDTAIYIAPRAGMMSKPPLLSSLGPSARAPFTQLLLQCSPQQGLNASSISSIPLSKAVAAHLSSLWISSLPLFFLQNSPGGYSYVTS